MLAAHGYSPSRQALTAAAIAVALAAQQITSRQPYALSGWALYALAVCLIGTTWRAGAPIAGRAAPTPVPPSPVLTPLLGLAVAGACVAGTTVLSTMDRQPVLALLVWVAGFVAASLALRGRVVTPAARGAQPWSQGEVLAVTVILALGAVARLSWIDSLPRYYFDDESRVAVFLLRAYETRIPDFFRMGWNTWPVIGLSAQGMFVPFLGLSTTTLRLSSALMGTLAVLATYLLARHLFSTRVALLAAVLLAIGRTAIDFSRLGICHAQVVFLEPLAFYWGWRAVNTGKAGSYLWAGIGTGLCLYSYNAGQSLPVLGLGWLLLCVVRAPSRVRTHWRGGMLMLAGFALTVFPWMYYVTDQFTLGENWNQWTYMARNRQVLEQILTTWQHVGPGAALIVLRHQVALTWLGFTSLPAEAYGLGYQGGGMLDHVSAPLFVLGLAVSWFPSVRARGLFLLYWWGVTAMLGGVLTGDAPAFVRLVGLLPAVAILAALPLEWLLRSGGAGRAGRVVASALVSVLLVGAGWDTWRTYFVDFPRDLVDLKSELARELLRLPHGTPVYLVGSEPFVRVGSRWHVNALTFNQELFSTDFHDWPLVDVAEPAHVLPLHHPGDAGVALVLGPSQLSLLDAILERYPNTTVTEVVRDKPVFRVLAITPEDMRARAGLTLVAHRGGDTEPVGIADPFAEQPAGREADRLVWSGGMYWPTDQPATLAVQAARPLDVHVGGVAVMQRDGPSAVQRQLELPRGWQPITIEAPGGDPTHLAMLVKGGGEAHHVTRWDLRPDAEPEGLTAIYSRNGRSILRTIDPQLNSFASEGVFPGIKELPLRMPFSVSWTGSLRIDTPGKYEFEAQATGPYSIVLDGAPLLQLSTLPGKPVPETPPDVRRSGRTLEAGLHPVEVQWDAARCNNAVLRRLFQLYWTRPDGRRELIPARNFVPAG